MEVKDIYKQITCKDKTTRRIYYLFSHAVRKDKWYDGAFGLIIDNKRYLYVCIIRTDAYGHPETAQQRPWWIHEIIDEVDITPEEFQEVRNKFDNYVNTIDQYECKLKNEMNKKLTEKCNELQKQNKVKIKRK